MIAISRSALLAAAFAAIGVLGEVAGCIFVLGLGILSLAVVHRDPSARTEASSLPALRQFLSWGACTFVYASCVLLLSPLASMPAVVIALLLLSPLFGTLVCLASSAVASLAKR